MGRPTHPARRITVTFIAAAALVVGGIAAATPALADTAPTNPNDPKTPVTVTADALDTPQIDGVVWTQALSGNTDFAGGSFSTARPAGAAAGTNTVSRPNLLSYNITTGLLNSAFAPSLNAQVKAVVATPDGKYVFAGGAFTTVNGVSRNRIVKLDATTGAVVTSFPTVVNSTVNALAISGSTLYIGGAFSNVTVGSASAVGRTQLAAVNVDTGALLPWNPKAVGGGITALTVAPDASKVVVGGAFTTLNGSSNPGYGLAAVDTGAGALLPWAVDSTIRNGGNNAAITSLTGDSTGVYGTGYVFGAGGTLEGTFHSDWNGNIVWIADCHGDTYSTTVTDTAVYSTGHSHYCGTLGGFPQTNPVWTFHRATAFSKAATTTLTSQPYGGAYTSYTGKPGPSLLNWNPDLATGTYTGKTQAGWSLASNNQYVLLGGEFPTVNGKAQQGLVRFAIPSIAPKKQGPLRTGSNFVPNLVSTTPGRVKVSWVANADRDNSTLVYRLYRDGGSTPIYTVTQDSTVWLTPQMGFTDASAGSGTHSYKLTATDPDGNVATGNSASVSVAGSAASGYLGQVLSDGASNFWRLDESSGTVVKDYAGYNDMVSGSGVTRNVGGATADGDSASSFNGTQATNKTSTSMAATQGPIAGPNTFTQESWFKTTSTAGGKIVGFGDESSGEYSSNFDRHTYMGTDGKVNFGIYSGGYQVVTSPTALNNGAWHQVVGTVGGGSIKLYVDGQLVATKSGVGTAQSIPSGYWRIGGDSTWSGGMWFAGSIDDVSIYPGVLSASQVQTQYTVAKTNKGGTTPPPPANTAPTAAFTQSTSALTATLNGSSSSDSDGTISSYAWKFGDGTTGTGATVSHTYATANTYPVTLTVTDNDGATGTTTQNVTVTAGTTPPPASGTIATDTFARTVSAGWGSADVGGAWTKVGGASGFAVANGSGTMLLSGPGATIGNYLGSVSQTSVDLTTKVSLSTVATGGGTQVSLQGRKVGSSDYRATLLLRNDGTAKISLVASTTTIANPVLIPGTIAAGTKVDIRLQVTGTNPTTVRAKAWIDGTTEPAAWTVSTTDTTAGLQVAGSIGILGYESGSATNGAQTLSVFTWKAVAP